jgi:hypothetical protein
MHGYMLEEKKHTYVYIYIFKEVTKQYNKINVSKRLQPLLN